MKWERTFERLDDYRWRISKGTVGCMKTDAVVFASEGMLPSIASDNAPMQAANVACLPGIVGDSLAMPDIHWGYGFPIGGVAAVDADHGYISPGGIGFDINCGVRLIRTDLNRNDVSKHIDSLMDTLYLNVPSGLGSKGLKKLNDRELSKVLELGSEWAVQNGYGWDRDLEHTEEGGRMKTADSSHVSDRARKRGIPQLGSLGSGNHFLEVDVVEKIFDERAAKAFGLSEGMVTVTVHCGSRGCGHQIATDYLADMSEYVHENGVKLPDPQLACAPLSSDIGRKYFSAMSCGANYAWANRQMITHWVRESFEKVFSDSAESLGIDVVYDVAHNIAKKERHRWEGGSGDVVVHRKGATRAFAPGRPELPMAYRDVGQPVIVPGDMSTGTYVLVGAEGAMTQSFGSSCHGAGREMSRKQAVKTIRAADVKRGMREKSITLRSGSDTGLAEEAPSAYKNLETVIDVVVGAGLTGKVAKLTPIGVVKG